MSHIPRQRDGASVLELVVVIAIIGVLVSLLATAVVRSRETARRTDCLNNIRQTVIAAQHFHNTHDRFPGTTLRPGNPVVQDVGWAIQLLEFMDDRNETSVFDGYAPFEATRNLTEACGTCPRVYLCPSSTAESVNVAAEDGRLFRIQEADYCFNSLLTGEPISVVTAASRTMLVREMRHAEIPWHASPTTSEVDWTVGNHGSGTLLGFVDGHVQYLTSDISVIVNPWFGD